MNEDDVDDDDIQPYSTRYLASMSASPPTQRSQTDHYYLPADHHIVRHTYVDPNSPDSYRRDGKTGVTRKDGVQAYLMHKLKLRGPRPGEGYEDAVPVKATPSRSKNVPVTPKTDRRHPEKAEGDYDEALPVHAKNTRSTNLPLTPKPGRHHPKEVGKPEEIYKDAVPVYAKPNRSKSLPVTPKTGRRYNVEVGEQGGHYSDAVPVYAKPNRSKSLPVPPMTGRCQAEDTGKPGDYVYEDAVTVSTKPHQSKNLPLTPRPGRRQAGKTGELPNNIRGYANPNQPSVDKTNSLPLANTKPASSKKPADPPKKSRSLKMTNLTAIDEEDHEYEETRSYNHHAAQNDLGMKGGPHAEMEANKDYHQLTKSNIYEKPEVVIGSIQLSDGV
ncbi:uncharacterized protein LOC144864899 [Branchiostoma floridae x Branchiostoma japonicum]